MPTDTKQKVSALEAQPEKSKRRGRPKSENPVSAADRQKAHRQRQREAAMQAYGHPEGQPTAAILAALGRLLAKLDDPKQASEHDTLRSMAAKATRELVSRYGFKHLL